MSQHLEEEAQPLPAHIQVKSRMGLPDELHCTHCGGSLEWTPAIKSQVQAWRDFIDAHRECKAPVPADEGARKLGTWMATGRNWSDPKTW